MVEVVVIGAGAAGIGAARQLAGAGLSATVLEARYRIGGRAWTAAVDGMPLDLGCGWLHSADRNPWCGIFEELGFAIDRSPPAWERPALEVGFPMSEQRDFRAASASFYDRLDAAAPNRPDRPAADLLEPGCRWNPLLNAVSTYVNGTELDRLSVEDFGNYADSGVNWRVREGYGSAIGAAAAGLDIRLATPVLRIDHSGRKLGIETAGGALTAEAAIVTVSSALVASEAITFSPALPDKVEAARVLPLGLADKLFLSLDDAGALPAETRLFGATDSARTPSYHLRPFGRPVIEAYFAGSLARDLEGEGEAAFADFATTQLAGLLGLQLASRMRPLSLHRWGRDPFARGSYSHALPGHAGARAMLAAPVEDRLFFAGEATSRNDFSTAHGAYLTGVSAAEQVLQVLRTS